MPHETRPRLVVVHKGDRAPTGRAGVPTERYPRSAVIAGEFPGWDSGDGREDRILTALKNAKRVRETGQGDIKLDIYRVG